MLLMQSVLVLGAMLSPGFLLVWTMGVKLRTNDLLILSFVLSLLVNYFVMIGLALLGPSAIPALLPIYGLGAGIGLFVASNEITHSLRSEPFRRAVSIRTLVGTCACLLAAAATAWIVLDRFEPVFTFWDAVVSYNRWSVSWSRFQFPNITYGYPQLITSNIGLTYVLSQSIDFQLYGRLLHASFFLIPPVLFLNLNRLYGGLRYPIASAVYVGLTYMLPGYLFDGMMDVPVAVVTFIFAYFGVFAPYLSRSGTRGLILQAAILGAAPLTKQAGLAAAVLLGARQITLLPRLCSKLLFALVFLAVFVPWYVYSQFLFWAGRDVNALSYQTGELHNGRGPIQRVVYAYDLMISQFGVATFWLIAASLAVAILSDRKFRAFAPFILTYLCIWALFWSYDIHNVTILIPFFALGAGIAIERGLERGVKLLKSGRAGEPSGARTVRVPVTLYAPLLLITILGGTATLSSLTSRSAMLNLQIAKLLNLGTPLVNEYIRAAAAAGELRHDVFTNYLMLDGLPDFRKYHIHQDIFDSSELEPELKALPVSTILEVSTPEERQDDWVTQRINDGHISVLRENQWIRVLEYRSTP